MAATGRDAVIARIKSGASSAADRVYPQMNTQEPETPLVIVTVLGGEGRTTLKGQSRGVKPNTLQVESYGATQDEADALAAEIRALLTPNNQPWRDRSEGVQGCFFEDTADATTADGLRVVQETYRVMHSPT